MLPHVMNIKLPIRGHLTSYSQTTCPSHQAMSNLEQFDRNFALHSRTTQGMCVQNITGISNNEGKGVPKKPFS